MSRKVISAFGILFLLIGATVNIAAKPAGSHAAETMVKEYLCEKMNSITARNVDVLDKYYSKQADEAEKYLLFTKNHILQDYLISYANNNYAIKKLFPNVKIISTAEEQNTLTINALMTAFVHWNAENSSGDPVVGMISERHELQVIKENGQWKIIRDNFETGRGNSEQCRLEAPDRLRSSLNELRKTSAASLSRSKSSPPSKLQIVPHSNKREQKSRTGYSRDNAFNWAQKHWKNYSNDYINFGKNQWDGGDCTNFVSQCIRAGGAENDTKGSHQWYYIRKGASSNTKAVSYSWTWSTARGLNSILLGNYNKKEFGPKGIQKVIFGDSAYTSDIGEYVNYGDIIQYEFTAGSGIKHSAIIVGMVHNSALDRYEPVIATHSFDSWNLPWTKDAYRSLFVHIADIN